jgi:hypothetical protein
VCGEVTLLPAILYTVERWMGDADHELELRQA